MEDKKIQLPEADVLQHELNRLNNRRAFLKVLYSTIASLLVVAALAVLISMLFLPVLRVTGTSMMPTLQNEDLVVCQKRGSFEQGDVIAFYYNNKILLKRVIAVSGDYVDIDDNGNVWVKKQGEDEYKMLDEPYVTEKALGECDITLPYQVPDQRIFVTGDNRATSIDSRSTTVGCVFEESVVGKVTLRLWPLSSIGLVG
ncbi:MAG: signal peptidase I [Ruminococcus sp.]|nr:signal peptidase I [Ruminococcus sp.]